MKEKEYLNLLIERHPEIARGTLPEDTFKNVTAGATIGQKIKGSPKKKTGKSLKEVLDL